MSTDYFNLSNLTVYCALEIDLYSRGQEHDFEIVREFGNILRQNQLKDTDDARTAHGDMPFYLSLNKAMKSKSKNRCTTCSKEHDLIGARFLDAQSVPHTKVCGLSNTLTSEKELRNFQQTALEMRLLQAEIDNIKLLDPENKRDKEKLGTLLSFFCDMSKECLGRMDSFKRYCA